MIVLSETQTNAVKALKSAFVRRNDGSYAEITNLPLTADVIAYVTDHPDALLRARALSADEQAALTARQRKANATQSVQNARLWSAFDAATKAVMDTKAQQALRHLADIVKTSLDAGGYEPPDVPRAGAAK